LWQRVELAVRDDLGRHGDSNAARSAGSVRASSDWLNNRAIEFLPFDLRGATFAVGPPKGHRHAYMVNPDCFTARADVKRIAR
jgi:hypothetical protein